MYMGECIPQKGCHLPVEMLMRLGDQDWRNKYQTPQQAILMLSSRQTTIPEILATSQRPCHSSHARCKPICYAMLLLCYDMKGIAYLLSEPCTMNIEVFCSTQSGYRSARGSILEQLAGESVPSRIITHCITCPDALPGARGLMRLMLSKGMYGAGRLHVLGSTFAQHTTFRCIAGSKRGHAVEDQ